MMNQTGTVYLLCFTIHYIQTWEVQDARIPPLCAHPAQSGGIPCLFLCNQLERVSLINALIALPKITSTVSMGSPLCSDTKSMTSRFFSLSPAIARRVCNQT